MIEESVQDLLDNLDYPEVLSAQIREHRVYEDHKYIAVQLERNVLATLPYQWDGIPVTYEVAGKSTLRVRGES